MNTKSMKNLSTTDVEMVDQILRVQEKFEEVKSIVLYVNQTKIIRSKSLSGNPAFAATRKNDDCIHLLSLSDGEVRKYLSPMGKTKMNEAIDEAISRNQLSLLEKELDVLLAHIVGRLCKAVTKEQLDSVMKSANELEQTTKEQVDDLMRKHKEDRKSIKHLSKEISVRDGQLEEANTRLKVYDTVISIGPLLDTLIEKRKGQQK